MPVAMTALCVARVGDHVYVVGDNCTHEGVALSDGYLDREALHVECWRHSSCFSLVTGEPDAPPATTPVTVYRAWVEGSEVFVEL
jgi:3-phenylpropionate/trans-cinnamate dioxygenase ferredoxin subunit